MTPEPFSPGYRLIDGTELNDRIANPVWSSAPTMAAVAGGDVETSAKVLTAMSNIVDVPAPNSGVVLPQALEGTILLLNNASLNNVVVYAAGGSTVNGIPGDIGDVLLATKAKLFFAISNLTWISADFGSTGATALYQLTDVNVTEGPAIANQYLKWDNVANFWEAGKPTEIPTNTVSASGALTVNRSLSEIQIINLTNNVTSFSITNWPATGILARVVLRVNNTGAFNINAWPANTKWVNGGVPTITSGAGKTDIFVLLTFDGGATIFATIVGQNYF